MKWRGIDVSDNQGVIDWEKVKSAGCQFAILRSVRRSGKTDYQFKNNLAGCRKQSIPVAVYKYMYAVNTTDSKKEAQEVVNLLKESNLKCKVFWDIEDNSLKTLCKETLTKIIQAAQEVIEAEGYEFCLYTGYHVYNEKWFDYSVFSCPLWIARYPSSIKKALDSEVSESKKPNVGRMLYGWQFSSNGEVDGISTAVDLDILYEDPETLEQLEKKATVEKVYVGVRIIRAVPKEKEGQEGYKVRYPNGYESWCPKEAFELVYRQIDCLDFLMVD